MPCASNPGLLIRQWPCPVTAGFQIDDARPPFFFFAGDHGVSLQTMDRFWASRDLPGPGWWISASEVVMGPPKRSKRSTRLLLRAGPGTAEQHTRSNCQMGERQASDNMQVQVSDWCPGQTR
jgi:hypothetical protein